MNSAPFRPPDLAARATVINKEQSLSFRVNGKVHSGLQGDSLASAMLANGKPFLARSFKYHRKRGIMGAWAEEPNAIFDLGKGASSEPNARATTVELHEGLEARSVNAWPSLEWDIGAINQLASPLLSAGFYYKTFLAGGAKGWKFYEHFIRKAAGLGKAPTEPDPDRYEKIHHFCDLLVVGSGPAGLSGALAAARAGLRVTLADDFWQLGGTLLHCPAEIDGKSGLDWLTETRAELVSLGATLLERTAVFSWFDHNYLGLWQRVARRPAGKSEHLPRERIWKCRAKRVLLATGAIERPLVYADNDLPGTILASAAEAYAGRFGVSPGSEGLLLTNNNRGYASALVLKELGIGITRVVDCRTEDASQSITPLKERLNSLGVELSFAQTVVRVNGDSRISRIVTTPLDNLSKGAWRRQDCDFLLLSGGMTPSIHLFSQSKGEYLWKDELGAFLPGAASRVNPSVSVGACAGEFSLVEAIHSAHAAAALIAEDLGKSAQHQAPEARVDGLYSLALPQAKLGPAWPSPSRRYWAFVDFQNDVKASDLKLAVREGMRSVEHVKRFTTTGMASDQGKLSNNNALGILSEALEKPVPEIGLTTFRPPYVPVTFGALAGRDIKDLLDPERVTALHDWHHEQGAKFEAVGQWQRAWYYPKVGETLETAVAREARTVRQSLGLFDASTLGKIEVKGPDAAEFLNRVYTNSMAGLCVGRLRYGLMLNETGMIMDDGVAARMGEEHFYVTTTTGGAAPVLAHLEDYLQTEWPELKVHLTSVTEQWATMALAGPLARACLSGLIEGTDISAEALPFMSWTNARITGVPARIFRVSFSGELAFEISVPASFGPFVWQALWQAGKPFGITAYGTETMHLLRAEKGYVIVGQDTDGSMTPMDMGLKGLISKNKSDFIGKRSLERSDMTKPERKQFVGLTSENPEVLLPEGSQLVSEENKGKPPPISAEGFVSSSYRSPTLGKTIALGLVKGGHKRGGEKLYAVNLKGDSLACWICDPVFYDKEGSRLHA